MKKVLMVVGSMNVGGIENYIMTILRNVDKSKVELDLLYITDEVCFYDCEIQKLGHRIIRITGRSTSVFKHTREFKNVIKKERYDIVHIHYGTATCMLDAKIAKKCKVKKVIVHSHNSNGCNPGINYLLKTLYSKYVDIKLSCSKEASVWMFRKSDLSKVIIVKNAIETNRFKYNSIERKKIRRQLNIDENAVVIGEISRFSKQKNHIYLLEVLNEIIDKNYIFLFVGEGPLMEEFQIKAKKLKIIDRMIFTGNVREPEKYLNVMDLFVMPSLYEGFPISLIEAQCNGMKCVVSKSMDHSINITGNVSFLGIDAKDRFEWTSHLCDINNYKRDESSIKKLKDRGYDISQALQKIYSFYDL